ncbi:wax ester/triacylglycerol synthase domain-containing protein [Nostocoides veronense]|uniref:diacylglycerol O-acyltransferase n=1 Tax=Nostocoides veronense TaxID=330836 RepID=A0ABN2LU02_9MICO
MTPTGQVPMTTADHFLHRSEGNPRLRSSYMSVEILDRVPDWERFLQVFESASREVARLRQRVVSPTAPTTAPRWVIDADFDLRYHVRRVRLPGSGSHRELLDFAEQLSMTPLELTRPLWRVTLVEGLDGGAAAMLVQMSHAVSDGMGGIELFGALYDLTRDGRERPVVELPVPHDLEPRDLTIQGVKEAPGRALGFAKSVLGLGIKVASDPVGSVTGAAGYAASLRRVLGAVGEAAPSPLLAGRGLRRRAITLEIDLPTLKAAGKALGGSVNDAYLAAMTGGLRRYHEGLGVPVAHLPLAIPVSLRSEGDTAGGNQWTGLILPAPVGEADPAARIHAIRELVQTRRAEPALDVMGVVSTVTSVLPDLIVDPLLGVVPPADVQCSNVMSYPGPTFIAGAQIVAQYGLGPVPGVGMMAVMITRLGRAFIGVRYDTASFTDDELLERSLTEGFDEVFAAAGVTRPLAGSRPAAKKAAVRLAPAGRAPARKSAAATAAPSKAAPSKAATSSASTKRAATTKSGTNKTGTTKAAKTSAAKKSVRKAR